MSIVATAGYARRLLDEEAVVHFVDRHGAMDPVPHHPLPSANAP